MKIQILDLAKGDLIGGLHPKPYRHFHRALSKRFPFAIFYTVEDRVVKVLL